nr:hypothetical protein BgiMline_006899 [Biomphalaria glabrata]
MGGALCKHQHSHQKIEWRRLTGTCFLCDIISLLTSSRSQGHAHCAAPFNRNTTIIKGYNSYGNRDYGRYRMRLGMEDRMRGVKLEREGGILRRGNARHRIVEYFMHHEKLPCFPPARNSRMRLDFCFSRSRDNEHAGKSKQRRPLTTIR